MKDSRIFLLIVLNAHIYSRIGRCSCYCICSDIRTFSTDIPVRYRKDILSVYSNDRELSWNENRPTYLFTSFTVVVIYKLLSGLFRDSNTAL